MKTRLSNREVLAHAIALSLAVFNTGCLVTYQAEQTALEAALREDIRLLQEENRRLAGRLEGIELELERVSRAVDQLRQAPGGPSVADVQALQQRVSSLEHQLRNVDAARERDRKEIIDTLTARISQLLSAGQTSGRRQGGTTPAGAVQPSQRRSASGAQEGYEHVVGPGESLSAIAAAYGVSVRAIVEANNLQNPNQLRVGQKLFIPAAR